MSAVWTVAPVEDDGPWEIRSDGALVDTVPRHYDVQEVLSYAEARAGKSFAWRLDDAYGFASVVTLP